MMETPYITTILIIVFFTGFVKIATTLSIFRYGIGLQGSGFGVVIVTLSLALAFVSVEPFVKGGNERGGGIETLLSIGNLSEADRLLRPFLEKKTDKDILAKFSEAKILQKKTNPAPEDQTVKASLTQSPLSSLIAAFLVTELKGAFTLGLMILIPFLLIDLVVTNVLMVLSVTQIPHQVVSLPLKLLLFVAVDGWILISQQLLSQYQG